MIKVFFIELVIIISYSPKKNEIYFHYVNFYGKATYPKKGKFFGTNYIDRI